MPLIEAAGVQVNFPFDPYPCQVAYMEKMIQSLRLGQNAILESPTGTGKTLCLLCSSLAWLENKKAQVSNQRMRLAGSESGPGEALNEFREALTGQLDSAAGVWDGELAAPKIIFASRTHSQLTQAIQELKRTAYRHFKVCVLGSREQLCIHPQVSKEESNSAKVHLCRAKVQNRSCHFYNQLEAAKGNFANQVLDIEDLVTMGQKHNCCPYYAAREMKAEADIIFMPYNYLLDVKSRRAHGVELQGNVVIFDEAHNLEKICEDSASFDLSSADIASAMRELSELSDKVLEWVKEEEMGASNLNDSQMAISQDFTLKELLQLKAMLADLEEQMDAIPLPKPTEGVTKPGSFIFDIMRKINLTFETKIAVLELVEKIVTHLTNETTSGIFHSRGAGLSKFADVIKLVFSRDLEDYNAMAYHQKIVSKFYKVHLRQEEPKKVKKSDGWGTAASSGKTGRILSYWCFSPGHAMEDLRAHGVKSIILTSGTLSPLSSFKTEMGIKFHVELENPHVIEKHQVWIGTISKGPDGSLLNSSFRNRSNVAYQSSMGNAVVNFARVVPNGLLIFFPSYAVMNTCIEHWQSSGIWSRIEQYKPIFIEPRHKAEFQTAMINFYEKINDPTLNGAIFAAVCRGKVSEGLDFSDNNGRAVVITGLPFPPRMDPKVMLKMQFLDELRKQGTEGLTGQEWYRQQATRAVNQAIGRVIRHKQDFGAILLCDNRFASSSSRKELPIWVRPAVTDYSAFGLALRDLMVFFKTAEKLVPAPGPPKERVLPPAARGSSGAYFMPTLTRTSSEGAGSVMRASAIVDHAPSLRRRPTINEGMSLAKLRVEYEASSPELAKSSRSAGNSKGTRSLIDALSTNEKRGSELAQLSDGQVPSYQTELRASQSQAKGKKKIVIKKAGSSSDVRKDTLQSAEAYLAEVKETLSSQSYAYFSTTLSDYKKTEDFLKMVSCLAEIFTSNAQSHHLFRRFYRFVRPHHKEKFDQTCKDLIGQGCGFTPKDAIPKKRPGSASASGDQKRAKLDTAKTGSMDTKSTDLSTTKSGSHNLGTTGQSSVSGGFSSNPVSSNSVSTNSAVPTSSAVSISFPTAAAVSTSAQSSVPTPDDSLCISSRLSESGADSCNKLTQSTAKNLNVEKSQVTSLGGKENTMDENPPAKETGGATCSKPYQHGQQDLGVECCRCHQVAKIPFKAPCEHVCCVRCWKDAINETKSCPRCGAKVKKKNLTQVCFGSKTEMKQ